MLQRIRLKIAAAKVQRTQEADANIEQSSSSSTVTIGARINERRGSNDDRSEGSSHVPVKPITLTRDGLKHDLLAKAAEQKSNSKRQKVTLLPPPSTTFTRATTPGHERLPDTRSSESDAILRLLGR